MMMVVAIPANGKQGTEMRIGEHTEICMIHVAPLFDLSTTPQLSDQIISIIIPSQNYPTAHLIIIRVKNVWKL